jgi:hypothetical protein
MRTFLVSYDLATPAANKPQIVEAIMQVGQAWARPLDNVWYLRADATQAEIEARISRHLGCDDGLLIQEARGEAAFLNTGLRWFRQRRTDANAPAVSNVVQFPAPATVGHEADMLVEVEDEFPQLKVAS